MKQSADVKTWRCAVGAGIVPLCPGWAVLGDEASQTGEVRMAPTFPSAATVLDNARPHAGTFGSRSLSGEDRVVSRTRPPAHSVLASSALRHYMQHVVAFSASIRRHSLEMGNVSRDLLLLPDWPPFASSPYSATICTVVSP